MKTKNENKQEIINTRVGGFGAVSYTHLDVYKRQELRLLLKLYKRK